MGFVRSSSNDGKEMAEKSQKRIPTKPTTTTTEVVLNECCKKCRMNKILLFAQAIVNVILIALILILFVMISGLKNDLHDKLLVRRPKSVKSEKAKVYRPSSSSNIRTVNKIHPAYPKRTKSKHTEQISINISQIESISTISSNFITNGSSIVRQNYTNTPPYSTTTPTNTTTTTPLPTTPTTKKPTTTSTTTKSPTYLDVLEIMDAPLHSPKGSTRDSRTAYKYDSILVGNSSNNCTCIGRRGKPGHRGERGRRGKKGIEGPRGINGVRGDKGQRGLTGRAGKHGPRGDVGRIGLTGPQGGKGEKGESGRIGINDRPIVHLTGYAFAAQLKKMPAGLVTNLQHTEGFGDLVGGFKYKDGIITIPEYGFYHIYSQIFFQHDERELDPMLVHYVYLFRNTEKWILMQSYVSKPEHTRSGQAFFTTNTGGVFRLLRGDKIALGVDPEHLTLISYAESTTYFGAYLI